MGGLKPSARGKLSGFIPIFAGTKARAHQELEKYKARGFRARVAAVTYKAQAKGRPKHTSFQVLLDRVHLAKIARKARK